MGNKQASNSGSPEVVKEDIRDGPVKKRSCTDILCLLLFLAFIGGWIFVAYLAFSQGDIDKVLHPTDSKGKVCGRGELEDKPYLMFFDLTKCLNVSFNFTEWKFQEFSITQILREINFRECRSCKTANFAILGALNFVNLVNFSPKKVQKFIIIKIQSL